MTTTRVEARERIHAAWDRWKAEKLALCPLCGKPELLGASYPLSECRVCGPWWKAWGYPAVVTPYIPAPELVPALVVNTIGVPENVLDVGSGGGTVGAPAWSATGVNVTVLDIFPPKSIPPSFVLGDARDIIGRFGAKSFDVVMVCDMIEHVDKEIGRRLLAEVFPAAARKLVVLTCPNGYSHQDPATSPEEPWANNPYQKHLCGWTCEEFQELGYTVHFNGINECGGTDGAYLTAWRAV